MTRRRHKLSRRLLLILLICGFLAIGSLLSMVVLIISNYTQSESISQAQSSAKLLERKIQELGESSLHYARTISDNANLTQAVFSKDTGMIQSILASAVQNSQADFIIVANKAGETLYSTMESTSLSGTAAQAALSGAQSGTESTLLDAEIASRLSAVSIVPVKASGTVIGSLVLGYALDKEKIVDGVKDMLGDDVTIFLGDTRINTTITKDGQRVIGTQASSSVVDRVLKRGESFSGNITIEGMPYIVYYLPLKDTAENVIGILFGGNPQAETQAVTNQMIVVSCLFGAAALALLALILSLYTRQAISRPLGKLLDTAKQIASGDLNVNLSIQSGNEIGELSDAFLQMSYNLNDMIGSIDTASEQITEGARQVSMSSVALASGATQQASAVAEFSSSLEQISAQTTQNADRASQANDLSRTALTKAEEGNVQMRAMLQAMAEINKASQDIGKIIKVIDDIAFQTNILALNAAVEAARAGEHGKGFAVVAEEVRNLAARSAEAAKETTSSIGQSIKEVEKGTRIADATADMLSAIVGGVSGTAALVNDIADACAQQVLAIQQMGQGINRITGVMQSNSATSEQNSAASEELLSQAEFMKKQVAHFTLRVEDAPSASPRSIGLEG